MASPDFKEYIDLTVNDIQPEEIYALAKEYAIAALPEFDPRTGTVEDAMLQSMSFVSGLVTASINRLPDSLIEGMLRLLGFSRQEATFATGAVIFSTIDDAGLTIPAGTQVSYSEVLEDSTVVHIFETGLPATIDQGDSESAPVQIIASEVGVKPVIADGDYLTILTPIGRLLDAQFTGALVQGEDSESDFSFFNRASTYFASLSSSLTTATQTTAYVLSTYQDTYRVQAYDLRRLPVLRPTIIGYKDTGGFLSIYPDPNGQVTYTSFQLDSQVVDSFYSSKPISISSAPAVDNATVVRVFDSTEPDYDGIYNVSTGAKTSGVTRFTYPVAGSERNTFCFIKVATTENVAVLSGLSVSIDGQQLFEGDLVLLKNQTTALENGVYLASSSTWVRLPEMSDGTTFYGAIYFIVKQGVQNGGTVWATNNGISFIIGSVSLSFVEVNEFPFSPKVEILDTVKVDAEDSLGAITIFLSDATGASLTAEQKSQVADDVSSRSIAGLSVYVTDVITAEITVNATIGVTEGFSKIDVKNAVTNYINNALSPGSFAFSPVIRKNVLIANIARIAGVDYVQNLDFGVASNSEAIASIDAVSENDLLFNFTGTVPSATATIATI